MKKEVLVIGLSVLLGGCLKAETPLVDTVAKVNGQIITAAELDRQTSNAITALHTLFPGSEIQAHIHQLKLKVLDVLIERDLMIQSYQKTVGQVPETVIDQRLDVIIKEDYGGDRATFEQALLARGTSLQSYWNEIALNYMVSTIRAKNIRDKVPATLHDEGEREAEAKRLRDAWETSLRKGADIQVYLQ